MTRGESQFDAGTNTLPKETPPPVPDWNKSTTSTSDASSSASGDKGKSSLSSSTNPSEGSSEGSLDFAPSKNGSSLDLLTVGKNNSETLAFFKQSAGTNSRNEVKGYGNLPAISFGMEEPSDESSENPDQPPAPLPAPFPDREPVPTSSETNFVHQQLQRHDIEPTAPGITIGVLDQFEGNNAQRPLHGESVQSFIDGHHGLVPGAQVQQINFAEKVRVDPQAYIGRPDAVNSFIEDVAANSITQMNNILQDNLQNADPSLHVLNMSLMLNNSMITQGIYGQMMDDPTKYREWMNELVGEEVAQQIVDHDPNSPKTEAHDQLMQAIANRVHDTLHDNHRIDKLKEEYRDTTQQAADSGVAIVVITGNNQDDLVPFGTELKPGDTYNWFAQSEHVIAVGGSDSNGTPGKYDDDTITDFSSHGDAQFHPTIVAQANHLPAQHNSEGLAGTSYAAPQVAATVALMMAQNPNMSFQEIKQTLEQNATKIPNVPVEAQGAGILRPQDAIIAAHDQADQC